MSEYTFGDFDTDDMSGAGEPQSGQQSPKWFREYMDKVSGQLAEIKAENDRLKAEKQQQQVANTLKAKGYAPNAAELYTGTPDKLDDWLTAHGGALAKLPGEGQEQHQEQVPQGPPASTVPADGQEQMQRMMEQGAQGVAAPQGSDKEIAAALDAAQTPEEFAQIMRAHGSQFNWG
ncbi:hypothetical protein ACFPM3_20230 [Streptomyces coeruleoprunus]|uniref:Scaffolding protein n=1 Tax=Streptomyces coeruleoprunus TaxID=285563 RepID=A0ABV9XJT8_9ACTN